MLDTCYSRNRYGTATWRAERLPSSALDAAVFEALVRPGAATFEGAVRAAAEQRAGLRDQHEADLAKVIDEQRKTDAIANETVPMPSHKELQAIRNTVATALKEADTVAQELLVQEVVHEIRVQDRGHIVPTFTVPMAGRPEVRPWKGCVDSTCHHANPKPLVTGPTIALAEPYAALRS